MSLMKEYNLLTLINLDPSVIILIFCMTKWKVFIKHLGFILRISWGWIKLWTEPYWLFALKGSLTHQLPLFRFVYFTDISLKMSIQKQTNKLQYSFPRRKFKISGENWNFWKLVCSLRASQFLKIFSWWAHW